MILRLKLHFQWHTNTAQQGGGVGAAIAIVSPFHTHAKAHTSTYKHKHTHTHSSPLLLSSDISGFAYPQSQKLLFLLILTLCLAACSLLCKHPQCLYLWMWLWPISATWQSTQLSIWVCAPPLPAEFTRVLLRHPFTRPSPSKWPHLGQGPSILPRLRPFQAWEWTGLPSCGWQGSWEKAMGNVENVCEVRSVKKGGGTGPRWDDDLEEVDFQYSLIPLTDTLPSFGTPNFQCSHPAPWCLRTHERLPHLVLRTSSSRGWSHSSPPAGLTCPVFTGSELCVLPAKPRSICVKGWLWCEECPFLDNTTEQEIRNWKILFETKLSCYLSTWTWPSNLPCLESQFSFH